VYANTQHWHTLRLERFGMRSVDSQAIVRFADALLSDWIGIDLD
jgi:hypothetical protein